ncbi:TMEM175 family protein [Micromonospora sp. WMMD812]|uniref:TMEM175 family protein n=1 Tax=Micromonospora sp. WMMD812 TaxID=3015152 RepID=UPI00248B4152|nr:TMEM175 family protein [Micromonospora sp. WMMD812]WBB67577.1 TMEM175 family protein [Micromonospora sp. WMMD812]
MRWYRAVRGTSTRDATRSSNPIGAERDPKRVVTFSDAVIAIAVTLLVLEIRPPEDTHHLLRGLLELWPSYVAYGITFLLIGQMWVNHHVMFDHIRSADRMVLLLNTLLLLVIAFLPFASSVLAEAFESGHGKRTALIFYGVTYELAAVLFNVIWEYARRGRRLLTSTTDDDTAGAISRRFHPAPVWIAAGTALGALHPVVGLIVVAAFIPFYWLPIKGEIASLQRTREQSRGDT